MAGGGITPCYTPHGSCPVPVAAPAAGELSFVLEGIGCAGLPLERVAQYMTALADLVGDTAVFVRMFNNSIVFVDGGVQ